VRVYCRRAAHGGQERLFWRTVRFLAFTGCAFWSQECETAVGCAHRASGNMPEVNRDLG